MLRRRRAWAGVARSRHEHRVTTRTDAHLTTRPTYRPSSATRPPSSRTQRFQRSDRHGRSLLVRPGAPARAPSNSLCLHATPLQTGVLGRWTPSPSPGLGWSSPSRTRSTATGRPVRVVAMTRASLQRADTLATEEPIEIRARGPGQEAARVAVTMRTPGGDFELAGASCSREGLIVPATSGAWRTATTSTTRTSVTTW